MTFGSLFAGIGGFDLGFEKAGMQCKWQVENDDFCCRILEKHWPKVQRWNDVRTFPPTGDWSVDIICGGFPCQDISIAGKRAGIDGERSSLWYEFARIIRSLRPRYVVVENVAALLVNGMDRILGDLAACGYDAEWDVLHATQFGGNHKRARVYIIAYTDGNRLEGRRVLCKESYVSALDQGFHWPNVSAPLGIRKRNGIPNYVDRIRAIGNAVVPQIAEWIASRILHVETSHVVKVKPSDVKKPTTKKRGKK